MNGEDKGGLIFWAIVAVLGVMAAAANPIIGIGIVVAAVLIVGSVND